jgi:hypothetical protein
MQGKNQTATICRETDFRSGPLRTESPIATLRPGNWRAGVWFLGHGLVGRGQFSTIDRSDRRFGSAILGPVRLQRSFHGKSEKYGVSS